MQPSVIFESFISNSGRNGKVMLVRLPDTGDEKVVCKISRIIDFSVRHEFNVMRKLHALNPVNFPRAVDCRTVAVDSNYRTRLNPFKITPRTYTIDVDALFMEHVDGVSLEKFVKCRANPAAVPDLARQVLAAVCEASETHGFTHYDLHPGNIIVRKTADQSVSYTIAGKTVDIETHGLAAVIIDFGLSYIDGLDFQNSALFFTNIGVLGVRARPMYDARLFLVGLYNDMDKPQRLRRLIERMFKNTAFEWENGWDVDVSSPALSEIYTSVYDKHAAVSRLFSMYGTVCLGLVQSLIRHPIPHPRDTIKQSYHVLQTEFSKIEDIIGSEFYTIYILKHTVDAARAELDAYFDDTARTDAVSRFKQRVLAAVDTIAKFANVQDVNWDKLLCAVIAFSLYMCEKIYEHIDSHHSVADTGTLAAVLYAFNSTFAFESKQSARKVNARKYRD